MKDPYEILGVQRTADEAAIRAAYRKLAKTHHPDVNPGKPDAAARFGEISSAYDLLSDKDKRARFDRGEIDASGTERPRQRFYRDFADSGGSPAYASDAGFADFAGGEDIFAEIFGRGGRGNLRVRGPDAHYRLEVDFLDATNGAKRQITLPDGEVLEVAIPPGTRDGQILRVR
jgi:DnaJ-class molecular chaperone